MHTPEHSTALPRESSAALIPANKAAGGGGGLFRSPDMSTCPHCGHQHASVDQRLRSLFAARVGMAAKVNRRNDDASHNELATEIRAAEDVVDPRSALTPEGFVKIDLDRVRAQGWSEFWEAVGRAVDKKHEPRAVGFIEVKPDEQEPDRWDADWDGGVK